MMAGKGAWARKKEGRPGVYHLSPRALSIYSECPRCFWLDRREGVRRPSGPFPSLPGGMDRALKRHFDDHMKAGTMPPGLVELGGEGYHLFSDEKKQSLWQGKGLIWENSTGDSLEGKVDYILEHDGKLVVLDFKTRASKLTVHPAYYQAQVDIYTFLLDKKEHPTEDHALLLFYYPIEVQLGGLVEFGTQLVRMQAGVTDVQAMFDAALRTLRMDQVPRSSPKCDFCQYVKGYLRKTE